MVTSAEGAHTVPPDGCVDIVYSREMGLRAVGAMTVRQDFRLTQQSRIIGLRFRPGMARMALGLPVDRLTDLSVPLEDLWGKRARELSSRIGQAEALEFWTAALIAGLDLNGCNVTPTGRAIRHMAACHGNLDLDRMACESNLSPRQFRRRCLAESGLISKRLCRILRFRYAQRLSGERLNWPGIAATAGYFDQSHLIRDFREFMGQPPMSVLSNTASAILP